MKSLIDTLSDIYLFYLKSKRAKLNTDTSSSKKMHKYKIRTLFNSPRSRTKVKFIGNNLIRLLLYCEWKKTLKYRTIYNMHLYWSITIHVKIHFKLQTPRIICYWIQGESHHLLFLVLFATWMIILF